MNDHYELFLEIRLLNNRKKWVSKHSGAGQLIYSTGKVSCNNFQLRRQIINMAANIIGGMGYGGGIKQRSTPMGLNDEEERDEMTNSQAKEEARKRYGKNFLIIKDPMKSSPRQRRQARRDYIQHTVLLKARTDLPPKVRRQVDASMHVANKVSTYYQYKIGTIMRWDIDFVVFTMYVEGDSWEDCFTKLKIQSDDKKIKKIWGVSSNGTYTDRDGKRDAGTKPE